MKNILKCQVCGTHDLDSGLVCDVACQNELDKLTKGIYFMSKSLAIDFKKEKVYSMPIANKIKNTCNVKPVAKKSSNLIMAKKYMHKGARNRSNAPIADGPGVRLLEYLNAEVVAMGLLL